MSRIRRISIRGIRNFGDERDESTIRFARPLTLILGPNGTGKTTIIEALKFATTGEFPPNSDRGKSFIHDPVLSSCPSVRGVVKAEFVDSTGNVYTVARTIETSKSNAKAKLKTLDSALSRMNKGSNQIVTITHRCANIDTEVTLAMGVSKPILNYVIFCHQEDYNWPFLEGKGLKEKFDEIFDSARFNKALESIVKYSKEMQEQLRNMKVEKGALEVIVNEVKDKETKLEHHKERLQNSKTKITEIDKELKPIEEEIRKIEQLDFEYKTIIAQEERKKAEYVLSKKELSRLRDNIQEIFEGTTEELNAQIESYDDKLLEKSEDIRELEARLKEVIMEESKITDTLGKERINIGTLRQQVKEQQNKIKSRNRILREALSAFSLDSITPDISEIEVAALITRLKDKLRELENKVELNRKKRDQEETEVQTEVDSLRTELSRIESEKHFKENEVLETRAEIDKIRSEITQLTAAASKLNVMESKIQDAKNNVDKLTKAMDVDAARKAVQTKITLRDETDSLLNKTDEEIASLLKISSLSAELDLHKDRLCSKEKEVAKLVDKHEKTMKTLLDTKELPRSKLNYHLDVVQQGLVTEIKSITQAIQVEERHLATFITTVSYNESEIKKMEKEINLGKQKISAFCDYKEYDEALLLQSRKVKDLQDQRGMYAHQGVAYKEYMKQLQKQDPCCPLCRRGFNERENVTSLLKQMEAEMESHPCRLKQCETDLKIEQEKYDSMLQLKPIVEKVIRLEEKELETLMMDFEKTKKKVTQARNTITELETRKVEPEQNLAKCKEIMGDVMLWDTYIDEISTLKETIETFQDRMIMAGVETKRTLAEAQAQREELKVSLKNVRIDIENMQSKINMQNEQLNQAREAHNKLHEEQLKIRTDIQKLKQLKEQLEGLFSKEISLGKTIDALREKLTSAGSELKSGIQKLENKKKENRMQHERDRALVTEGIRLLTELHNIQDEIEVLLYREIPKALKSSELKIEDYQKSIADLTREKNDIENTIRKFKEDLSHQEIKKRTLTDNVLLRKTEEILKDLRQQYADLKEKVRSINYDEIVGKGTNLQNQQQALLRQKNIAKGSQDELEKAVQQYSQELTKEIYRKARKNYKNKCIELTVQEECILNLKAYSKVLDTAMIEYHEERMSTVNKIMKQLWRAVYTGTDTTSIEIRTQATEGVGNLKRTYNYKLVQIKHGHEMDMRGRCSAGQKILASIIIRLALAETFCKDCGILALDEPTTNLDEENANSLANALATIVKTRAQHQRNFQLIVISHDEKFLLKLADINNNKGYYELYRKHNGYTAIRHTQLENRDTYAVDAVKAEASSDEESTVRGPRSRDKASNSGLQSSTRSEESTRRKRNTWQDDDDPSENRPPKRRYVFNG